MDEHNVNSTESLPLILKSAKDAAECFLKNCRDDLNSEGLPWTLTLEKPEMKLKIYSSSVPGSSFLKFKAVIELPFPPALVEETVGNKIERLTWDTNMGQVEVVNLLEQNSDALGNKAIEKLIAQRTATKAVGPISARDFVDIICVWNDLLPGIAKGSFVSAGVGQSENKYFPPKSGVVRGLNSVGCGMYMERIPLDENQKEKSQQEWGTRVRYVIHSNLKGWLPAMAVNKTMTSVYVTFFEDLTRKLQSL